MGTLLLLFIVFVELIALALSIMAVMYSLCKVWGDAKRKRKLDKIRKYKAKQAQLKRMMEDLAAMFEDDGSGEADQASSVPVDFDHDDEQQSKSAELGKGGHEDAEQKASDKALSSLPVVKQHADGDELSGEGIWGMDDCDDDDSHRDQIPNDV